MLSTQTSRRQCLAFGGAAARSRGSTIEQRDTGKRCAADANSIDVAGGGFGLPGRAFGDAGIASSVAAAAVGRCLVLLQLRWLSCFERRVARFQLAVV